MIDFEFAFGIKPTPIERRVLAELQRTDVVSNRELLERAWEYHADSKSRTVETTMERLRKKLPDGWVRTIRNVGYQLAVDPEVAVELAIKEHGAVAIAEAWFALGGTSLTSALRELRDNHVIRVLADYPAIVEIATASLPRLLKEESVDDEAVLVSAFCAAEPSANAIKEFAARGVGSSNSQIFLGALSEQFDDPALDYLRRSCLGWAFLFGKRYEEADALLVDDDSVPEFYCDRLIRIGTRLISQQRSKTAIHYLEKAFELANDPNEKYSARGYLAIAYTDTRDARARTMLAELRGISNPMDRGALAVEAAWFELSVGERQQATEILGALDIQSFLPRNRVQYHLTQCWVNLEHDLDKVRAHCSTFLKLVGPEGSKTHARFFVAVINWLEHGVVQGFVELVDARDPVYAAFSKWVTESPEEIPEKYQAVLSRFEPDRATAQVLYDLLAVPVNVD